MTLESQDNKTTGCCPKCYGRMGTLSGGGTYCHDTKCPCHPTDTHDAEIEAAIEKFEEYARAGVFYLPTSNGRADIDGISEFLRVTLKAYGDSREARGRKNWEASDVGAILHILATRQQSGDVDVNLASMAIERYNEENRRNSHIKQVNSAYARGRESMRDDVIRKIRGTSVTYKPETVIARAAKSARNKLIPELIDIVRSLPPKH